ncbi:MAG TPA: orotate phosphoribosyltransferase [Gemmatimonadales bacterium]|jgi:orotate phosphoribosyltransferase|nr:orotate phosphoribosyltransferase [Gemmatimonadales bacterium]
MTDLERLRDLLLARSVTRGDFTLSSGRKSTFYIDARRTTMSGDGLALIGSLGLEHLAARGWAPRAVGGLTLGADPVAYAIAAAARTRPPRTPPAPPLDAFTIRKQAKTHGTGRRIEGCFEAGQSVVVVEDVITTGGSAQEAIAALSAEGAKILGVFAVVDRGEGGREVLERAGHPVEALLTAAQLGL